MFMNQIYFHFDFDAIFLAVMFYRYLLERCSIITWLQQMASAPNSLRIDTIAVAVRDFNGSSSSSIIGNGSSAAGSLSASRHNNPAASDPAVAVEMGDTEELETAGA